MHKGRQAAGRTVEEKDRVGPLVKAPAVHELQRVHIRVWLQFRTHKVLGLIHSRQARREGIEHKQVQTCDLTVLLRSSSNPGAQLIPLTQFLELLGLTWYHHDC